MIEEDIEESEDVIDVVNDDEMDEGEVSQYILTRKGQTLMVG